jgi:hypothetical protein
MPEVRQKDSRAMGTRSPCRRQLNTDHRALPSAGQIQLPLTRPVAPMLAPSDRVLISTRVVDLVECCSPMCNQIVSKGEAGPYKVGP